MKRFWSVLALALVIALGAGSAFAAGKGNKPNKPNKADKQQHKGVAGTVTKVDGTSITVQTRGKNGASGAEGAMSRRTPVSITEAVEPEGPNCCCTRATPQAVRGTTRSRSSAPVARSSNEALSSAGAASVRVVRWSSRRVVSLMSRSAARLRS